MSWIKVEDKLPQKHKSVIVTDSNISMDAWLGEDNKWYRHEYRLDMMHYKVIAWQPMPKWEVE